MKVSQVLAGWYQLVEKQDKRLYTVARYVLDFLAILVKACCIAVLLFTFVFHIVTVDGTSMLPTLEHMDRLVIQQICYTPQRGDIVVVTKKTQADGPIIKRVVGVEGDLIDIDFESGVISVNGAPLHEDYISEPIHRKGNISFPQVVPEGCVFVLGDNRNASHDSRWMDVGMVDNRYVLGKVLFRLYPHFGNVD